MTNVEELDQQLELTNEAYNEVIHYTLELAEEDNDDAINFLDQWNQGGWRYIADHYPEFDLNSEAQQWLIKESGGMPKE